MAGDDVTETDSGWTVTVDDAVVTQLQVGHVFGIVLRGGVAVQIEHPFRLAVGASSDSFRLATSCTRSERALPLFAMAVDEVRIGRVGTLEVRFREGAEIEVSTIPHYESWNVSVPGVGLWVGLPGGGVEVLPTPPEQGTVR